MLDNAVDLDSHLDAFCADVLAGLSHQQKTLPCRWLYDNAGSELFEAITRLPEYYPTRTETAILRANARAMADFAGSNITLIEYGAGAGIKTETLIAALRTPQLYIPIDIAGEFLDQTATRIRDIFPGLRVQPVTADFMIDFELPAVLPEKRRVAFFPGSTIGNLNTGEAGAFLRRMRRHVGEQGAAIVGIDLKKNIETVVAAYDDAAGVTSEFNLNLLARINRELDGDFVLGLFRHSARWNNAESAVEMHLVSRAAQTVTIGGRRFDFEAGETIHTESSRKYDHQSFAALCAANGWRVDHLWTDDRELFGVFGLSSDARH
jgi:L-histidine N-alpha-methyltransferase